MMLAYNQDLFVFQRDLFSAENLLQWMKYYDSLWNVERLHSREDVDKRSPKTLLSVLYQVDRTLLVK